MTGAGGAALTPKAGSSAQLSGIDHPGSPVTKTYVFDAPADGFAHVQVGVACAGGSGDITADSWTIASP